MVSKIFQVTVVLLFAVFTICGLALLLTGASTFFRPAGSGGGISSFAFGVSSNFLKLIAVAAIVLLVGLFGLTRLRRFLK